MRGEGGISEWLMCGETARGVVAGFVLALHTHWHCYRRLLGTAVNIDRSNGARFPRHVRCLFIRCIVLMQEMNFSLLELLDSGYRLHLQSCAGG